MHQVAYIPGDGIGPEIMVSTQEVLAAAGSKIEWIEAPAGDDGVQRRGHPLPLETLAAIRRARVALKSPLAAARCSGGVTVEDAGGRRQHPSVNNGLRRELKLFANVRPVRSWPGVPAPVAGMDLVIFREITEDTYSGLEQQVSPDCAEATKRITRQATERIARYACQYALTTRRQTVSAIHKANVLHLTDGLFLRVMRDVVAGHAPLRFDELAIDAACYLMVKAPSRFDVMVLPNQYGDIISDLAAGLVGSLGLAPGSNVGDDCAVFEAAHGAAPDIAGQGVANPVALILSGAMMLDHLGEREAAERIRSAVERVLRQPRLLPRDLGGTASTAELTRAICGEAQAG